MAAGSAYLSTSALASAWGGSVKHVCDLMRRGEIEGYRMPGHHHVRRISLASAIDYCQRGRVHSAGLIALARDAGLLPPGPLTLLLVGFPLAPALGPGFDVAAAGNCLEAVDLCCHRAFAAVLIDCAIG